MAVFGRFVAGSGKRPELFEPVTVSVRLIDSRAVDFSSRRLARGDIGQGREKYLSLYHSFGRSGVLGGTLAVENLLSWRPPSRACLVAVPLGKIFSRSGNGQCLARLS